MTPRIIALSVVPLGLLAACGGGGSSTTITQAGPNGLPYGASGLVASQARFEQLEDTKITLSGVKADTILGGGAPFTNTSQALTGEITLIDDDTVRLELDGEVYLLDDAGGVFTDTIGGQVVSLTPGFAGSVTSSIFFFKLESINPVGGEFSESFLLTGFETKPSDMPSGTFIYNGTAGMLTYETDGLNAALSSVMSDTEGATGSVGDGDLNVTVDFATGDATGAISGTAGSDFGSGAVNLNLIGTVSGNDIAGTLTDVAGNTELVFNNGADFIFSGHFYGKKAADVGGTFVTTISGTEVSEPGEAVGFFIGSR